MKNYTILLEYCTNAEGNLFQKIYYGIDGVYGEFIAAHDVELGSEYDELIINFCQIIDSENMPWMRFKDLTNGHISSAKTFNSVCLGTRNCSVEEYKKSAMAIYEATEKLRINLFTLIDGEVNNVSKRVYFDQSKGVYTREDIQRYSR